MQQQADDVLRIGRYSFAARLLAGVEQVRDAGRVRDAVEASGAELVAVTVRSVNIGQQHADEPSLADVLPPAEYTLLPSSAGALDAGEAVQLLTLARALWLSAEAGRKAFLAGRMSKHPYLPSPTSPVSVFSGS